jgi:DNA recombination protein RmuC
MGNLATALAAFLLGLVVGAIAIGLVAAARTRRVSVRNEELTREVATAQGQLAAATARLEQLGTRDPAEMLAPLIQQTFETMRQGLERTTKETLAQRADEAAQASAQRLSELLDPRLTQLAAAEERLRKESEETSERIAKSLATQGETARSQLEEMVKGHIEKLETLREEQAQQLGAMKLALEGFLQGSKELEERVEGLTAALQRSPKMRGTWGEIVLERLLESSGLSSPREYEQQVTLQGADGNRLIADVVLHLPGDRHLVIDSKVSLVEYQRALASPDDPTALQAHVRALRAQVQELTDRHYERALAGSLDGVFLFVPIESALYAALQHDPDLLFEAHRQGVYFVTPTSLIPTLKLVAVLWQGAESHERFDEMLRLAGSLLDKLAGFSESFARIEQRLQQATEAWQQARNQLVDGKGNVQRIAIRMRQLGARHTKALHASLAGTEDLQDSETEPIEEV